MASSSTYPTHAELMANADRLIADFQQALDESQAVLAEINRTRKADLAAAIESIGAAWRAYA